MPFDTYLPIGRFELRLSRECDALPSTSVMQDDVLQLYDACAPDLRRYVRSCGLTPESAEDVVQEAFLALFRHLCVGGARHNLRGWLVQVSYRLALKDRERLARRQRVETPWETHLTDVVVDPTDNPEADLAMRRHRCRLQSVFRALPERQRQCLVLRAEGLPYRHIADALGISLGTVAKSLTYAIARLSNAVKGQHHAT